ncbi:hypothetical protein QMK19_12415 [Streptomyces sp. H10-C2]|uniref:hypothetical protein n=1 Tax=unclassified Streptomyces TaxID=2593676 RepID=UPI0024BA3D75|nr:MULTISPECIES: hypothetical protein [unclassified Streptomyces]MDJ0346938.1 hypothetical protein [Streptomyces sp. PH10-H1]MDJ0370461.1 hypothetical protein [Streptomyces sp. H10-C2]
MTDAIARRDIVRKAGAAGTLGLGMAAMGLLTAPGAAAQTAGAETATSKAGTAERRLPGAWTIEVQHFDTFQPGLTAFTPDGLVLVMHVTTKNIGMGNWSATGRNTFVFNFHILNTDPASGAYTGQSHMWGNGTFSSDTYWAGTANVAVYDAAGAQVYSHTGDAINGTRVGVDT